MEQDETLVDKRRPLKKRPRLKTQNPVLGEILQEMQEKEEQERCSFPYWGNWGNWGNWANWANWGNWWNGY